MRGVEAAEDLAEHLDRPRIGIVNGFGRSLGDGIIGLQALELAIRVGAIPPKPVLFRLPGLPAMFHALYAVADFAEVKTLP